jgi:hypothetical protein
MRVFHQTGFREKWNIESFQNGVGDGLIFSPVNLDADKLQQLPGFLKNTGFLDPQLYLLNEPKGTLHTYPYFPGNLKADFSTADLDTSNVRLAELCVRYQMDNQFNYLIIPTRYFDDNPTGFFTQSSEYFVLPFIDFVRKHNVLTKILLSIIVKPVMLTDEIKRNEVLNWITGHPNIDGVYLIFENNFISKQIKDFDYLLNALRFIKILKENQLIVNIGYTNTEAVLYSVAMADAVTIGGYENLRSFSINRFKDLEASPIRSPNARLYSAQLLQWVDYEYIQAMKQLVQDYENYFEDSDYKPLMFTPEFRWHFAKPEPYKHYFYIFNQQIKSLPQDQNQRIEKLKEHIKKALSLFKDIERKVLLDEDSDGSHLATWYNVLTAFQNELNV